MKGKMIKLLAVVMSAFFIFYAGYQAWRFFYNPYQTEITTEYSVSESLHVHGIAAKQLLKAFKPAEASVMFMRTLNAYLKTELLHILTLRQIP